jgi:hypothetical protein
LLFIKCFRIMKGFRVFNIPVLMSKVKNYMVRKSMLRSRTDYEYANDQLEDHNLVETLMYIEYALSTLKLVLQIFNISFFVCLVWYVYCFNVMTEFREHDNYIKG